MSFSLCIVSVVPVARSPGGFVTLDQWVLDLQVQLKCVSRLKLICEVVPQAPPEWEETLPVPETIEVEPINDLTSDDLQRAIRGFDVLQLPGGQTWTELTKARRLLAAARREGMRSVVAISSNRARTAVLNAASGNLLAKLKAWLRSTSIRYTIKWMSERADGAFAVGEGLRQLFSPRCKSVHVGVASWIYRADMADAHKLYAQLPSSGRLEHICVASRLEPMKGVHLAIDAFTALDKQPRPPLSLSIMGKGPERSALELRAAAKGIAAKVRFPGQLAYLTEFPAELRRHGLLLFTNLNDEQPRAIFDAIANGCIPICPRIPSYAVLKLPAELYYSQGDAEDLARVISGVRHSCDTKLLDALCEVGERYTFESMHEARAAWLRHEVLRKN